MSCLVASGSALSTDLSRLYTLVTALSARHGTRKLAECSAKSGWPARGVYFFFEPGELRPDGSPRLVRVGTHAVSAGSKTTLWKRLAQHRGTSSGAGNHRGSIFRLHVGGSLLTRGDIALNPDTWGRGGNAPAPVRDAERDVEAAVSKYIGALPFTWIDLDDEPGKGSARADLERNALGLLSASIRANLESPSKTWLGHHCRHDVVRRCGLWNVRCVDGDYDPTFLDRFERWIKDGGRV